MFTIKGTGEVGIGTSTPFSKFHLLNGSLLVSGITGTTPLNGAAQLGAGTRLMWIPAKAAFRAGIVDGTQWDDASIGSQSIALGANTKANGTNSFALGSNVISSVTSAFSIGAGVNSATPLANGITNSLMVGFNSTVPTLYVGSSAGGTTTGNVGIGTSTPAFKLDINGTAAMTALKVGVSSTTGYVLTAADASGNAIWQAIPGTSTGPWAISGNNINNSNTGNVGIGTSTPISKFDVENGAVLFNGFTGATPTSGSGSRFMWIPAKSALRAGVLSSGCPDCWDDINIGSNSIALGIDAKASGYNALAVGSDLQAIGSNSIVIGHQSKAGQTYGNATAIGTFVNCDAAWSHAIGSGVFGGPYLTNTTINSLVIGYNSDVPTLFVGPSAGAGTTGNIGIGNSAPAYKLDVTGTASMTALKVGASSTIGNVLTASDALGNVTWQAPSWTVSGTNIYSANTGAVGIGITPKTGSKLHVSGPVLIGDATVNMPSPGISTGYNLYVQYGILTERIKVSLKNTSAWADFVFDKDYKLTPLNILSSYINKNHHLPEIPFAQEVVDNGINLGEMDAKLLMKIEELTLYLIKMNEQVEKLSVKVEKLETENNTLTKQLNK